jgi:hypothetical protein
VYIIDVITHCRLRWERIAETSVEKEGGIDVVDVPEIVEMTRATTDDNVRVGLFDSIQHMAIEGTNEAMTYSGPTSPGRRGIQSTH